MIRKNISGNRYGRLSVISHSGTNKSGNHLWECMCDCGTRATVTYGNLTSGHTLSCGCLQKERTAKAKRRHGLYFDSDGKRSRLSRVWSAMKCRCSNVKCKAFPQYGGSGITVCEEWMDYEKFHEWATSNGYTYGLTIDRIDNTKGYSPENCRIATKKDQSRNRRNVVILTLNGESMPMFQWADKLGIGLRCLANRRRMGWDDSRILTTPVRRAR